MSTNDFPTETSILLPTRTSASGTAVNKTEYAVVDGITSYIYIFSFCGVFKGALPTLRPYKKLVYSMDTDSYFALSRDCSGYVYILNCRFEEIDRINVEYNTPALDISLFENGECAKELLVTSPHTVDSYTQQGSRINELRKSTKNIFYSSFVKTAHASAESFSRGCEEYVSIIVGCEEHGILIPPCVSLKNLFTTDGGGIYGFFGKNYANGFIIPLYENETVNSSFFHRVTPK